MIILVKAGAPVDATVAELSKYMEEGDIIVDGGNEWWASVGAEVAGDGPRLWPPPTAAGLHSRMT